MAQNSPRRTSASSRNAGGSSPAAAGSLDANLAPKAFGATRNIARRSGRSTHIVSFLGCTWERALGPKLCFNPPTVLVTFREIAFSLCSGHTPAVSLAEIKTAIEQLSFEERAELAAWFDGLQDDEWDEQIKRDVAAGKFDRILREVDEDIRAGRVREMP